MPVIVGLDNEYVSVHIDTDKRMVSHTFKKYIFGDSFREARRRGLGAALLAAAEEAALAAGKTLLVLDTAEDGDGDRLYQRSGWELAGRIPGYALLPDGEPCATRIFYKRIG